MVLQAVWGEGWGSCEVMAQGDEAMAVLCWDSSESLKIRDLPKVCFLLTMKCKELWASLSCRRDMGL